MATTPVGDRSVSAELCARDWTLGGEQSGHLIWTGFAPTGDGIAAALLILGALGGRVARRGRARSSGCRRCWRTSRSPTATRSTDATAVWEAVEREGAALEGRGRVLVRPSGTEPLVRVMVEAPAQDGGREVCARLVEIVRAELG